MKKYSKMTFYRDWRKYFKKSQHIIMRRSSTSRTQIIANHFRCQTKPQHKLLSNSYTYETAATYSRQGFLCSAVMGIQTIHTFSDCYDIKALHAHNDGFAVSIHASTDGSAVKIWHKDMAYEVTHANFLFYGSIKYI